MIPERPSESSDRSALRLLQVTAFVSTLDRFAMPPMLVAIAHDLGVPLAQVVNAAGAYFLAYGLMQPVWGMVSDRLGLVRTVRLTLVLAAIATTTAALAQNVLALGLLRGLAGVGFSAAIPTTLVYLGDTVPARRRQRDVTDLMAGIALGTAVAAAGAGALAQYVGWQAAFVLTGLSGAVLVVALRRLPEPPRTRVHHHVWSPLVIVARSGPARLVLLLALTEGAVLLGVLTLLPAAVEDTGASTTTAGLVTATYGVAVLACARVVGQLSRRVPPSALIAVGGTAAVLGCVVAAVSTRAPVGVLVAMLLGVAWAAMHSSLQTWATEVAPAARAAAVSLFAGSLFVGSALGALAVSGLADRGNYPLIFALAALLGVPLTLGGALGAARWSARVGGFGPE